MVEVSNTHRLRSVTVPLTILGLMLQWIYWPILKGMAIQWEHSPDYSHGWLIPLMGLVILWAGRRQPGNSRLVLIGRTLAAAGCLLWAMVSIENHEWISAVSVASFIIGAAVLLVEWSPAESLSAAWGGLALVILGGGVLIASGRYFHEWFERLAIVPLIAGGIWLVCGRRVFLWSLPAVLFLGFMVPLPFTLETALRNPLRGLGTTVSTYVMQTIGLPAYSEGYIIAVGESRIGVVEACSGLRMLMVFIALSAALVLLIDRPWWQRGLLLLGSLPVALISNILRITITGICYTYGWEHLADLTFHDLAGWLMMPVGILLLLAELWFLDRLFICEIHRPMSAGLSAAEVRFQG